MLLKEWLEDKTSNEEFISCNLADLEESFGKFTYARRGESHLLIAKESNNFFSIRKEDFKDKKLKQIKKTLEKDAFTVRRPTPLTDEQISKGMRPALGVILTSSADTEVVAKTGGIISQYFPE